MHLTGKMFLTGIECVLGKKFLTGIERVLGKKFLTGTECVLGNKFLTGIEETHLFKNHQLDNSTGRSTSKAAQAHWRVAPPLSAAPQK